MNKIALFGSDFPTELLRSTMEEMVLLHTVTENDNLFLESMASGELATDDGELSVNFLLNGNKVNGMQAHKLIS